MTSLNDDPTCDVAHGAAPAVVEGRVLVAVFASPVLRHVAGDFVGIAICYSLEAIGACSAVLAAISHASTAISTPARTRDGQATWSRPKTPCTMMHSMHPH